MRRQWILLLSVGIATAPAVAQISPGELSTAHATLEGMSRCTSCHELGRTLSDAKCLACHDEIRTRNAEQRGLHAQQYSGRHCVECHKEHHGRGFPLLRLDEGAFEHSQTGFVLDGAHRRLTCSQCHRTEHVKDADIAARAQRGGHVRYLGLSRSCAACHQDPHRAALGNSCERCHESAQWKPAPKFSHDAARFRLVGAHLKVACAGCHQRSGAAAPVYTGLPFASCASCHRDPHAGRFTQPCSSCHTDAGWHSPAAGRTFDHASTRFPLRGKHAEVKCARCHPPSSFHITRFQACRDCHSDRHNGQFAARADGGACEACHTVQGFVPSTYTAADHQRSRFPLTGAHGATPCVSCHGGRTSAGAAGRYRWEQPQECRSCHEDVHRGEFRDVMRNGCPTCHTTEAWSRVVFAPDSTRFPLSGAHTGLACGSCHRVDAQRTPVRSAAAGAGLPGRALKWEGSVTCRLCHNDAHAGQFGTRECRSCHTTRSWRELLFSHDSTAFRLTGAHAGVACERCHTAARASLPRRFAGTPTPCSACHATKP